jgi:hypothetical protein
MKAIPLTFALLASPLAAQTTFLDEDFTSGIFPPAGWGEFQTGTTDGWEADTGVGAFHDDFLGLSESLLISTSMDLSTATDCWLHLDFGQRYPNHRYINIVRATIDGGLTFLDVHHMASLTSGGGQRVELDLAALTGNADVRLAFYYEGDDSNEWWLERTLVDDQVPPPSNYWPVLPTNFLPVTVLNETFDGLAGSLPIWMTVNNLDTATRLIDAEAWCNIGQMGPVTEAFSGSYALEMGLDATLSGPHSVSNALIMGLNGTGFTGMLLHFQAKQFTEEWNPDDGVFVSVNGEIWHPVATDWGTLAPAGNWTEITVDLGQAPVDLNGNFYLAFAEADNYPFGIHDGVIIDDVVMEPTDSTLFYSLSNVVGGQTANIDVTGAVRNGSLVSVFLSTHGPGPVTTPYGDALMTPPLKLIGTFPPSLDGEVHETATVPARFTGMTIWSQVIESDGVIGVWSNGLAVIVQ